MSKWVVLVVATCVVGVFSVACWHKDSAFTLELEADSYGMFLPVNNQITEPFAPGPPPPEFYSGYLIQLDTFPESGHEMPNLSLKLTNGNELDMSAADVKWLNIFCEPSPEVLIYEEARGAFLPDPTVCDDWGDCPDPAVRCLDANGDLDPNKWDCPEMVNCIRRSRCEGRLIHKYLNWETATLITLWKGASGISVETTTTGLPGHGHDQFKFESQEACQVTVWTSAAESETHEVTKITVGEPEHPHDPPADHGGVHQPPWN